MLAAWRPGAVVHQVCGPTMGTNWRVRLAAPAGLKPERLCRAIQAELDGLVAEMSHWRPDSVLGRYNRAPAGSWHVLPPAFATVIAAAMEVAERSNGAFDPAIGALVDLWGFGPSGPCAPPAEDGVRDALKRGGWRRVRLDAGARRLLQPGGLRLDLSAIAKGHAADAVADLLGRHGCHHALVEVGGELAGRGMRPDGDPWWVDLETPGDVAPPLRVALHQLGVATSGDYVRGRHTIDPHDGRPVSHVLAVSVVHASAMWADAWATALGALAPEAMAALAQREEIAARALLRQDGDVVEWISPALLTMMRD